MLTLSTAIIAEKNKVATKSAWIILIDITLSDLGATEFYVTNNNEDVTFDGQLYTALPFELDVRTDTLKGEIPELILRVSNVTRVLQAYLEDTYGAVGSEVTIRVVNTDLLAESYADLEMTFDVIGTVADDMWIEFTLGAPNPLRKRFPLYRYISDKCRYVGNYKGVECSATSTLATCNGTLTDCDARGNSSRFGGFIGLGKGNIRIV